MPVPLGRSNTTPLFVLCQITYALSLFFLVLGAVRVALAVVEYAFAPARWVEDATSSAPLTSTTVAVTTARCLRVTLTSLFRSRARGAVKTGATDWGSRWFFWMHILTALIFSLPLSLLLQRRKSVADFVLTIYAVYTISTCLLLRRFFAGGLGWWVTVLCACGLLFAATWWHCRRRELQSIALSGDSTGRQAVDLPEATTAPGSTTVVTTTTTAAAAMGAVTEPGVADAMVEMEPVRTAIADGGGNAQIQPHLFPRATQGVGGGVHGGTDVGRPEGAGLPHPIVGPGVVAKQKTI